MITIDFNELNRNSYREFLSHIGDSNGELTSILKYLGNRFDENTDFIVSITSGSTGEPKTIQIQKNHLAESSKKTNAYFGIKSKSNLLLCLPVEFIAGKMMIERAILAKSKLIITQPSLNPLFNLSSKLRIDFAAFTPAQVFEIIQNIETAKIFENISHIIIGGGILPEKLEERLTGFRNNIYVTFGMTETISHFALRKVGQPSYQTISSAIKITASEAGNLILDIPYLGIRQLKTNDIVEIINPHTFRWLGRADFVINSGGIKLHPEQIEQKIAQFYITDGTDFFVFGLPDERFGQIVCLVVESDSNLTDINTNSWTKLGQYEIPRRIFLLKKIAKTPTGKINRLESLKKLNT